MISDISFARRKNFNFTTDSICAKCYKTIATDKNEANLADAEEKHCCDINEELDRLIYSQRISY